MISIDLTNLHQITKEHGLSQDEIDGHADKLSTYLENIHNRKQGFYSVIDDKETLEQIEAFAKKTQGHYNNIVVLGIGGSALGASCLQQSLKHPFENELKSSSTPRLHVIDNIDPRIIEGLEDVIELSKTLFIVVTKSGTTTETISLYKYFRKKVEDAGHEPKEHFVFITDPKKGLLREIANKEDIPTFEIPENVGGRFSVLSPVGLLPAALIDIDINLIIQGARTMRDNFLSENPKENLTFQLATIQYLLSQKGKTINVLMPYSHHLIRFADWYRQLLAESIGKEEKGITPVKALGVTDQHSQLQLYNDGPNDKLIIFIEEKEFTNPEIPGEKYSFKQLMDIEKNATAQSLTKQNRPNITIKIHRAKAAELGELFMLMQGSIAFLGEFFNIDAFNQPGVELSKKLTKESLEQI